MLRDSYQMNGYIMTNKPVPRVPIPRRDKIQCIDRIPNHSSNDKLLNVHYLKEDKDNQ